MLLRLSIAPFRQATPPFSPLAPHYARGARPSRIMSSIADTQIRNEQEIESKYKSSPISTSSDRDSKAAQVLQRTYRGHRERRQLAGLSLDPSTRWTEAIKEAQYRELTRPRPRTSDGDPTTNDGQTSEALQNWRRVGGIARHAGGDAKDDATSNSDEDGTAPEAAAARRRKKSQSSGKGTQTMDLSYFLEMVDIHHRYASNLRKYHAEWQSRETHQNFFYWLDTGEGKDVSLEICSRERLDSMKVRYLSREERLNYLTMVDEQGRLCWKRNGIRIDTGVKWKDSIVGIVPEDDPAPAVPSAGEEMQAPPPAANSSSGSDSDTSSPSDNEPPAQVPPSQILNRLVRKPSTKKSKWIFVADTSYNLYVGVKQSGSFQHSSFLHGSRISSAGLIKIKDGKIKLLQPRSGHYRPPASNFLGFINALKGQGVDMSAMSAGKSYAALVGVEGYMKGKAVVKDAKKEVRSVVGKGRGGGGGGGEDSEKTQGNEKKMGFEEKLKSTLHLGKEKEGSGEQNEDSQRPEEKKSGIEEKLRHTLHLGKAKT